MIAVFSLQRTYLAHREWFIIEVMSGVIVVKLD